MPHQLLAFDTSTDHMSLALTDGVQQWLHDGPGGAQTSSTLLPAIAALLAQADLRLDALDAVVFGRGPGSFTGLRTACAIAQGLAFGARGGAGLPVLAVDTLMAVAEQARFALSAASGADLGAGDQPWSVVALLDARMDEMYTQRFVWLRGQCRAVGVCQLVRPENLTVLPGDVLAGNVFEVYAGRLPEAAQQSARVNAWPTAAALLRLAPALLAAGHATPADQALPLYVRDKVAQTTQERMQAKAELLTQALSTPPATPSISA